MGLHVIPFSINGSNSQKALTAQAFVLEIFVLPLSLPKAWLNRFYICLNVRNLSNSAKYAMQMISFFEIQNFKVSLKNKYPVWGSSGISLPFIANSKIKKSLEWKFSRALERHTGLLL